MSRSRALLNVLDLVNEEEVPVEQAFLRDFKFSICKDDEKNIHVASKTYKPSGLNCIRFMWFQLTGATPKKSNPSPELIGICESGSDRHERIQDGVRRMKENNIDCEYVNVAEYVTSHELNDLEIKEQGEYETKLYNKKYNLSFLCDGIIRYKGKYYILEIKTETSNKYWDQKGVMQGHILQGTAYSLCFGIEDVLFLYENRDNCAKKTYMLHVTDEMREALVEKLQTCDKCVENNICPPKPDNVTRYQCSYCDYAEECKRYV